LVILIAHDIEVAGENLILPGEFKGEVFVDVAVKIRCIGIDQPLCVHAGVAADEIAGNRPALPPADESTLGCRHHDPLEPLQQLF
jgi:hypothetical protein